MVSGGGIYGLIDPRDGCLAYVGLAFDFKKRFKNHCNLSRLRTNTRKNAWLKCLLKQGLRPRLEIIEEVFLVGNDEIDQTALDEAEIFWLAVFRLTGTELKNDPNTFGGEGGYTGRHSEEVKAKMRGPRKPMSEATKAKMRKPKSIEHRAKLVASFTDERRARLSLMSLGNKNASRKKNSQ